jgi:hypothetical protein
LHDFVRQPTIFDYFVRDSALLGLDACAGRDNAGTDALTIVAQAQNAIVRSVRPDSCFRASSRKSRFTALRAFSGARHFGVARGRLWRKAAGHWHVVDGPPEKKEVYAKNDCLKRSHSEITSLRQ